MELKALSLLQPHAQLMADRLKLIETRSWATGYTGPLLIAASAKMGPDEREMAEEFGYEPRSLTLGAILCLVNLKGCYPTALIEKSSKLTDQERRYGFYGPGRFGWMTSFIYQFETPIPCKGALGLWSPPEPVLAEVMAQLPVAVVEEWGL